MPRHPVFIIDTLITPDVKSGNTGNWHMYRIFVGRNVKDAPTLHLTRIVCI